MTNELMAWAAPLPAVRLWSRPASPILSTPLCILTYLSAILSQKSSFFFKKRHFATTSCKIIRKILSKGLYFYFSFDIIKIETLIQ